MSGSESARRLARPAQAHPLARGHRGGVEGGLVEQDLDLATRCCREANLHRGTLILDQRNRGVETDLAVAGRMQAGPIGAQGDLAAPQAEQTRRQHVVAADEAGDEGGVRLVESLRVAFPAACGVNLYSRP